MDVLVRYPALASQTSEATDRNDQALQLLRSERRWKTFLTVVLSVNVFVVFAAITLLAFFLQQ